MSLHAENFDDDSYARTEGLSGLVYFYSKLFNTLISVDRSAAMKELKSWSVFETTVLAHLNIWVASKSEILSIKDFLGIIQSLSNKEFWSEKNQRDLLVTISSRWHELDEASKRVIEKIILSGPDNCGYNPIQFQSYSARRVLERLHWLNTSGCQLAVDIGEITKQLASHVPDWRNEQSRDAARSNEVRVSFIDINTDYSLLYGLSPDQILPTIEQLSDGGLPFSRNDPFQGLVDDNPVFALRVLTRAAKKGVFPARLWDKFLSSSGRKKDNNVFVQLIALRIASYEPDHLKLFLNSIARWLSNLDKDQFRQSHDSLISTISRVIQTMGAFPEDSGSSYARNEREPDWMMESINSPVGQIIESMFLEPDVIGEIAEIPVDWLSRIDSILDLPGDLQRLALVLLNKNLHWFYYHNSEWAEQALLSKLNSADTLTRNAAWAGLLWSNKFTNDRFYKRLKPLLMEVLNANPVSGQKKRLAEILLSGWTSIDPVTSQRYVSDTELISILIRSDDQFREAILSSANRLARSEESKVRWQPRLIELIALWPRRRTLKSANVTNCFLTIALKEKEQFPEVVRLILPLISKSEQRSINIYDLLYGEMELIEKHPMEVLNLIHTVLPSDVYRWPYEIGAILTRLQSANPELINNERLIELNRLWDSR